ncbi:MAG TPA: sensor histidine kinase [Flavipsychrobacter sp.]
MHTSEEKFYTAVIVAAIALGIIILVFIATMIRHQRRNAWLNKMRIRAEINTLEKERKRIAGDLHDELGPILSAVRIQINHLQHQTEEDQKIIAFANKHIDDAIAKTREISYNLLPSTLVRKGLVKAVHEYISKLSETHELHITFISPDMELPAEMSINIYRIIQEIIHNTIKHAEAAQLIISLQKNNNKLVLLTADDGKGFDYDKHVENNNGLGLTNLQSRAEVMSARFNFRSVPGYGSQYVIDIPIKEEYAENS